MPLQHIQYKNYYSIITTNWETELERRAPNPNIVVQYIKIYYLL